MAIKKDIPFCPVLSIGTGIDMVCTQDRCSWYIPSVKKCSMYIMAYNALLAANSRQAAQRQRKNNNNANG